LELHAYKLASIIVVIWYFLYYNIAVFSLNILLYKVVTAMAMTTL